MIVTLNLVIRFFLELIMLGTIGYWGWINGNGATKFLMAIGLPIIAAFIWFTFAVPNDPSRSGNAPVPVPGTVRLVIELVLFALSTTILFTSTSPAYGIIFGIILIVNYCIAYERVLWILKK
ncbi:MAG: YrdB family protein [Anaerolineales bacterium]|nr:YrdB family protein [Anaerolineales bacterium]